MAKSPDRSAERHPHTEKGSAVPLDNFIKDVHTCINQGAEKG